MEAVALDALGCEQKGAFDVHEMTRRLEADRIECGRLVAEHHNCLHRALCEIRKSLFAQLRRKQLEHVFSDHERIDAQLRQQGGREGDPLRGSVEANKAAIETLGDTATKAGHQQTRAEKRDGTAAVVLNRDR